MVEFTDNDRIDLYSEEGKPRPKIEELPMESITKKFNSRLSLKPFEDEIFDDEVTVSNLLKTGKK